MIEEFLKQEEGKTLEFKENTSSLEKVIKTIIAFANTSGGVILIGIKDRTKEVIGLKNIIKEEEKLANSIADSITPTLIPNLQFLSYRKKDILMITVTHSLGPYYLKSKGYKKGIYIRLGSTNRIADDLIIEDIHRMKKHTSFDELPNFDLSTQDFDFSCIEEVFKAEGKKISKNNAFSLGLFVKHNNKQYLSNAAILLFEKNRTSYFPDAILRLGRFKGNTKSQIIDHLEIAVPLYKCIDEGLFFIRRHTTYSAQFGNVKRKDISEYPEIVLREAITNAIVHADYSMSGCNIQIAIFDDRIEITNPGGLPLGLRLEVALSGVSQLRNKIIGRIFKELKIIEQWGSGFGRMIDTCISQGINPPKIEELDRHFRITLLPRKAKTKVFLEYQKDIINYLKKHEKLSAKQAQKIWEVTSRTTSSRLKKMCDLGIIISLGTSPFDPQKTFILSKHF